LTTQSQPIPPPPPQHALNEIKEKKMKKKNPLHLSPFQSCFISLFDIQSTTSPPHHTIECCSTLTIGLVPHLTNSDRNSRKRKTEEKKEKKKKMKKKDERKE
jgi:hypothetical protein